MAERGRPRRAIEVPVCKYGREGFGIARRAYVQALAAPLTINTMPENTLTAFADHERIDAIIDAGGGDSETMLA